MPDNEELKVPNGDEPMDLNLGDAEGAEVEISDDGEAQLKEVAEPAEAPAAKKPEDDSAEHEEYSARVKKRLDKMTAKLREAERREQAALEYARQIQVNLQQVQTRAQALDQNYINEYQGRVDSQLAIAEANLQDAVERGDGKAVVEAQKLLSSLIYEQQKLGQITAQRQQAPVQHPQAAPAQYQSAPQQYQQVPAQPQVPQKARPDPKAEAWAEKNEWFGQDTVMTHAAFGVHAQLAEEGFDLTSDEYYDELDRRIRKEFPHKFKKVSQADDSVNAPNVAPASRASGAAVNGRRTIKLTPSEVAIARKLGVPLEEYAKYVRR